MLIVQISDCHIVEAGAFFADRVDSAAGLRAAIDTLDALPITADAILLTGDLVNDGAATQYDHLMELLSGLSAPVIPVPGNHDDRGELRSRFPAVLPPGGPDDPIDYVFDIGDLRIIALDTTIPGRHDGSVSESQLEWLDASLAAAPERPAIIAQHHPPTSSGMVWMDESSGFPDGDREAEVIRRHAHVEAVVSGHLHRSLHRRYAHTVSMTCPSTATPIALGLAGGPFEYTSQPTGFLVHHWRPAAGLVSHVMPVGSFDEWTPSWAT